MSNYLARVEATEKHIRYLYGRSSTQTWLLILFLALPATLTLLMSIVIGIKHQYETQGVMAIFTTTIPYVVSIFLISKAFPLRPDQSELESIELQKVPLASIVLKLGALAMIWFVVFPMSLEIWNAEKVNDASASFLWWFSLMWATFSVTVPGLFISVNTPPAWVETEISNWNLVEDYEHNLQQIERVMQTTVLGLEARVALGTPLNEDERDLAIQGISFINQKLRHLGTKLLEDLNIFDRPTQRLRTKNETQELSDLLEGK